MVNKETITLNNYKCLNSLLSSNIANIVINYCPELYVQHCKINKKRMREDIYKLKNKIVKKKKMVEHYEKELKEWCIHVNIHKERYWDGHRGHTSYNCNDCGCDISSSDFGKDYKIVSHPHC